MAILGKTGAVLALAAMSVGAFPAEAQRHGPPRHRGHDRIDGGDVLLGAVLAGGLIALLSSKKKHEQAPPPEVIGEEDQGPPASDGRVEGDHPVTAPETRSDQDAAVDACVASAESEGRRYARVSKIDAVSAVDPAGAGWVVRGKLWLRSDYREKGGDRRAFSCRVGERGVDGVMIDGGRLAAQ